MLSPVRALLLLVLIAIPLLEIALLVKVGQVIGFWWTILIVLGTGMAGATLLHRQGLGALQRVMASAEAGVPPVAPLLDGVMLMAAGLLLLTPGLITDTAGLILLVPPVRSLLVDKALSKVFVSGSFTRWSMEGEAVETPREPRTDRTRPYRDDGGGIVIEGEYHRIDEKGDERNRSTGKRRE